jgi:hypothetical protein
VGDVRGSLAGELILLPTRGRNLANCGPGINGKLEPIFQNGGKPKNILG